MARSGLRLIRHSGAAIGAVIDELAQLRVRTFREWPYLYEGDEAYERAYLAKYATARGAVVVTASDMASGEIVGASTALPLLAAEAELRTPFIEHGLDPAHWYYFGESMLDAAWRGRGIGVAFFEEREAEAARLGFNCTAFCAVVRPGDHPARPDGYVPLDGFWAKRGYVRRPELRALLAWRDVGEIEETDKPMLFWTKEAH